MKKKATGQRGSWFAQVDGELLPCVHKHWQKGLAHHDPFERHEGQAKEAKIQELVDAVRHQSRVIMTEDKPTYDAQRRVVAFQRTSYVAVYRVEDVTYTPDDGLRFRLAERLIDLI